MPGHAGARSIVLVALILAVVPARGAESPEPPKLRFGIALQAKPTRKHFQDVVQKTPDLVLLDGAKTIRPERPGLIYHVERAEGDRYLVTLPGQGLYGWVARNAVIPYSEAEGYFTNELEIEKATPFGYLMRAIVCEDNERFQRSFADLAEALKLDPGYVPAMIERAMLWATRNRMDLALLDAERAIRADPRSSEARLERGVFYFKLKDYEKALADLDRARELGSRSIHVPMIRGSIYVERRQIDDAIKVFQEAISIEPKNYDAHLMLGSSYLLRSQPQRAVQAFSQAVKLEPEKGAGYGGRAVARMSLGQRELALVDLNQAIRYESMRADLFRDRGQIYAMEGRWPQAMADFDTALRVDANDVEANIVRAWTLATCPDQSVRNGASAVASATRACELTQWISPRALATLAAAYAESGDYTAAAQMQSKAIAVTPPRDPVVGYYQACLNRYRSGKPWHRVGLLEEIGLHRRSPAKQDAQVQQTRGNEP